jgi:hypothetical protein
MTTAAVLASWRPRRDEVVMAKEVTCPPCKEVIRGENDSDLVANVRQHMRARHHLPVWLSKIVRTDNRILRDARQVA